MPIKERKKRAGEEKLIFKYLKFIRYDHFLSFLMQRNSKEIKRTPRKSWILLLHYCNVTSDNTILILKELNIKLISEDIKKNRK